MAFRIVVTHSTFWMKPYYFWYSYNSSTIQYKLIVLDIYHIWNFWNAVLCMFRILASFLFIYKLSYTRYTCSERKRDNKSFCNIRYHVQCLHNLNCITILTLVHRGGIAFFLLFQPKMYIFLGRRESAIMFDYIQE